ncbi:MAG: type VI secretion system membrane subunit TssM [Caulobacteraceae bacterium]|nr:type VI secretion system membrane subunit TssM [Caulobacteraceae bacterium]
MTALKKFFGNWWVVSILAAVIAALVLALVLPLVWHWFHPLWRRLLLVLLVAGVWGVLALWRVLAARKASDRIADALAKAGQDAGEGATVARRMAEALGRLKAETGGRRDYLYNRPWYVIIGPPGAGKTTALINSGLRFPFAESALQGVGGTRNLDFWFADEAVMVDTAGRYTSQDSAEARDREGWTQFLDLLRKNRPLQPINGVLVAIGLDTLLGADTATIDRHASTIRRRLAELRQGLEIATPIYVMFTKADLMAGFSEFYDDLDVEGRRAVLGSTLPLDGAAPDAAAFAQAFDGVAQAVADRSAKRLQDELDARRRGLIVGFPAQFSTLRNAVVRFLDGAFPVGAAEGAAQVRGFYFTSGVQAGTPIDRLLSGITAVHDAPAAPRGGNRAYFINRLLTDVVLAEAGLVQATPAAKARRRAILTVGFGAIAAVAALVLLAWTVSFVRNRAYEGQLEQAAVAAKQQMGDIQMGQVGESDPTLDVALPGLDALRALPGGYDARRHHFPSLLSRFGLFRGGLSQEAERTYLEALQRVILPRVLLRLEDYQHEHAANALDLYAPLKAYLLIGGQHKPLQKDAVTGWIEDDWRATGTLAGAAHDDERRRLSAHLDAMLADKDGLTRVWGPSGAPVDAALITDSRQKIEAAPMADRAYALLKQKGASAGAPWTPSSLSAGQFVAFLNPTGVQNLSVPFFYTKQGYAKVYQPGLQTVAIDIKNDLWMLGGDEDKSALQAQLAQLKDGVANRYATDYVAAWKAVVQGIKPGDFWNNSSAQYAIRAEPSPYKVLLMQVRDNTNLSGPTALDAAAKGVGAKLDGAVQGITGIAPPPGGGPQGLDAASQITQAFTPLAAYVNGPLDDFLHKLQAALLAKEQLAGASAVSKQPAQIQLDQAMAALKDASGAAPPEVKDFVGQASQQGDAARISSSASDLTADYAASIKGQCQTLVSGHYPFAASATLDATAEDVARLFGSGAPMDQFQAKVQPYLNTSGKRWRWRSEEDPIAKTLDPPAAEEFQKAQQIRDLLSPGLSFQIAMDRAGSSVTMATVTINGISNGFRPDSAEPHGWRWTGLGNPDAAVEIVSDGKSKRYAFSGPWAVFKMFQKAENAGPNTLKVTFGEGASFATFKIILPSDTNPFSRGGPWSFSCPAHL